MAKAKKEAPVKKVSKKKEVKKEELPIDSFEMDESLKEDSLETLPEENGFVDDQLSVAEVLKRNKNK